MLDAPGAVPSVFTLFQLTIAHHFISPACLSVGAVIPAPGRDVKVFSAQTGLIPLCWSCESSAPFDRLVTDRFGDRAFI